ncbi:glucan 1,3-beta-glucosidase-like protein [Setomelanomma holmii]|uniref:Glucan 1,3-beta-glucosidase-like protein n=1 Tax=Setomelanomma holmii TaxID=210430 RepID=A0A9P4LJL8_9PLEO|nr:glucan 1,3-beta-glucosidase-like protein [Setomelanomma holmii]
MNFWIILLTLGSLSNMKGFLQKAKAELRGIAQQRDSNAGYPESQPHQSSNSYTTGQQESRSIQDPTPLDIIRYRYHHGTNLGSVYVIERWLQSSRFPEGAEGSSELAAVKAWVDKIGMDATQRKFEEQWAGAVTDEDIQWLVNDAKCTTIRLPIGYYDLPGLEFTRGTPFEPYAQVYSGAWYSIRTLIARLRAHSIGVLVDLHALPGGANGQEHSGTNSGRADFWNSTSNRALGVHCCKFLARAAQTGSDIAGIQLVNEAEWDAPGMYEWYDECVAAISSVDPTMPVVISDGWNLTKAIDYSLRRNSVNVHQPTAPVVVDTHYYWAFTEDDKKKSPQEITSEVMTKLRPLDSKEGSVIDRGASQVIVGEYSCVLTEDSWAKCNGTSREECVQNFGQAQSKRYQERAGGSFFWTWKMDWMPGGEWGFKAQSDAGSIVPPNYARLSQQDRTSKLQRAIHERDERMRQALEQHVGYWTRADPDGKYEHEKYEHGWNVGYQDALVFLEGRNTQGDKIGLLELWVLKRIRESGYRGGFTWLFEQGLRKGIADFYAAAGP